MWLEKSAGRPLCEDCKEGLNRPLQLLDSKDFASSFLYCGLLLMTYTSFFCVFKHNYTKTKSNMFKSRPKMLLFVHTVNISCLICLCLCLLPFLTTTFLFQSVCQSFLPFHLSPSHLFITLSVYLFVLILASWPLCFPFLSFLSLPVCGVELADALPFLAERGGCVSAITFTSSCSASCTKHRDGEDKPHMVRADGQKMREMEKRVEQR